MKGAGEKSCVPFVASLCNLAALYTAHGAGVRAEQLARQALATTWPFVPDTFSALHLFCSMTPFLLH